MRAVSCLIAGVLLVLSALACANRQTVMVPPRIDLKPHEMIGVVEFDSSSDGELGPLATRRFTESARRDQGLVRVVSIARFTRTLSSLLGGGVNIVQSLDIARHVANNSVMAEAIDGALATGMAGGAIETWDRLESVLAQG